MSPAAPAAPLPDSATTALPAPETLTEEAGTKMNAKERRAARRKDAQSSKNASVVSTEITATELEKTKSDSTAAKVGPIPVSPPRQAVQAEADEPALAAASAGTNAKQRRAAKREAERIAPSPSVSAASASVSTGGTAKERRAAKRAADRAAAETSSNNGSAIPAKDTARATAEMASSTAPTTAKERRAAKRAAARDPAANKDDHNADADSSPSAGTASGGPAGTTAKERRLLRREEERKKRERDGDAGAEPLAKRSRGGSGGAGGGRDGGGRANPHIVFVGQLAFSTTAAGLEEHFRTRGGVEGEMKVRLLTRKGTNPPRSKGMAFVEVGDAETAYLCLGLHHSRLDGRLLNVERTSGGGKEKKVERIKETRGEQKEFMKSVVQRVLAEFVDAGRLGKAELDDAAKGVLEKMEAKVMERAVKDYCDKPDRLELHNPSAWFTHHAHELAFRADPQDLDAGARDWLHSERVKAGGRDRDREKAAKKARGGERRNGGEWSGGRGGGGGRSSRPGRGMSARDGGRGTSGGRSVSGGTSSGDVRSGRGGPAIGSADGRRKEGFSRDETSGVGDTSSGGQQDGHEEEARRAGGARIGPPLGPAASRGGQRDGNHGEGGGREERYPRREQQRDSSDLMSIFPSLRGRGGGRGGTMAGRGGGGRGFRKGGIHA